MVNSGANEASAKPENAITTEVQSLEWPDLCAARSPAVQSLTQRNYISWRDVAVYPNAERRNINVYLIVCSETGLIKARTNKELCVFSGGASAVKEPGHFAVRKSSSQVIRMHFFSSQES